MGKIVELRGRAGFEAITTDAGIKSNLTPADPDRFHFRMESCRIGAVSASRIHMSPCQIGDGEIEDDDIVNLFLIMKGAPTVSTASRRWTFRPGQIAAQLGCNRYLSTHEVPLDHLLIRIDQADLADRGVAVTPNVVRFGPDQATTTTRGLSSLVKAVLYGQSISDAPVSPVIERALLELIVGLHHEGLGHRGSSADLDLGLHARAVTAIRSGYLDRALTPTVLADILGVGLRQLQRAFEKSGSTIAGDLRSRRAEHASTLLSDRRTSGLTLDEIAAASGFTSTGELRRAVRARYGATPSQLQDGLARVETDQDRPPYV